MAQQVEALEFQRIGEIEDMVDLVEVAVAMDAPRQVRRMAMSGQIQRTFVDQGDSSTVTVKLDAKTEFEGKAKISLQGLPQGVTAEDQEVSKDDKEVKFTVKADGKATAGQHRQLFCQFKLVKNGEEMMSTFAQGGVLRVDKAAIDQNTEKK